MEKHDLSELIKKAKEAYYNLDPIMSDQEYDTLLDKLKSLDPKDPEVLNVGTPIPANAAFSKEKHMIPMGSLNKCNTLDELKKWKDLITSENLFISHKIDGLSMELVYEGGKLVKAVTRGDGFIGENVTHNVIRIPNIPHKIEVSDCVVRGEVLMSRDVFSTKYKDIYANPRNTASAKIREKDGKECSDLEFRAYYVKVDQRLDSFADSFSFLSRMGFTTPELGSSMSLEECIREYENQKMKREALPYDIDGLVVGCNDMKLFESLGEINNRPVGQIAWKFDALMGISTAIDVKWQVGPTGRVVPVMVIEPVDIGGVQVSRVSLQNLSAFKSLRLFKGCHVLISRRNDVIPYCEKVLD